MNDSNSMFGIGEMKRRTAADVLGETSTGPRVLMVWCSSRGVLAPGHTRVMDSSALHTCLSSYTSNSCCALLHSMHCAA